MIPLKIINFNNMKIKFKKFKVIKLIIICMSVLTNSSGSSAQSVIKVAAIQMTAVKYDKETNFKKAADMIRDATSMGADIACLPECALTGYPRVFPKPDKPEKEYENELEKIRSVAEPIPGTYSRKFSELAKDVGIYIITGYEELRDGKIYNTSILISPTGEIIGKYSKIHLQNWMVFSGINPGNEVKAFNIEIRDIPLKIGINICYDIQVPESARLAMLAGADILFVPYCTNDFSSEIHRWLFRIRALENQFYLCRVNFASPYNNGDSMLIDPKGGVLFGGQQREGIMIGDIDLDFLKEVRNTYKIYGPYYRNPEAYTKICQ